MEGKFMTTRPVVKNTRIDLRVPEAQKEIISRAATLSGVSMTEFIATAVYQLAIDVIEKHNNVIAIPPADYERFLRALDSDAEPTPEAVEAAEEYSKGRAEGDKYRW
jgi:uncharacterized protein (DUF1778 family)